MNTIQFSSGGITYAAKTQSDNENICDGCAFDTLAYCGNVPACSAYQRTDNRNIIWVKKEVPKDEHSKPL